MPTKTSTTVALALLALATLPAAAEAAGPVELRLTHPRSDPRFGELVVDARCAAACTLRLTELNTTFHRRGVQLPHAARGEVGITRRLPAGKPVAIRVHVPLAVQGAVFSALPRRVSLLGHLAATVTTNGETYDVARQFTVVAPGGTPPFPPSATVDAFTVPVKPPAQRRARAPLYSVTVSGTQTSRWAYDRTSSASGCVVLDSGFGRQTLRFRSVRAHKVRQVWWKDGFRELLEQGRVSGGLTVPIRIDAVRDSGEDKGADPRCSGDYGGGEPGKAQCTRRGSVVADLFLYSDHNEFTAAMSSLSFGTPSTAPDCPVETAINQRDPLDLIAAPTKRNPDLSRGGSPGKVIFSFDRRDVTNLEGGRITTNLHLSVTFRKLG